MKHTFREWYHMIVASDVSIPYGTQADYLLEVIHDWGEDRLELDLKSKRLERENIKLRDELMHCRNKNP